MTDELRAAAERLIQCVPPDAVHQGIYADMDEMAEDAVPVARAYLAAHPPDDTPIDEVAHVRAIADAGRRYAEQCGRDALLTALKRMVLMMEHNEGEAGA